MENQNKVYQEVAEECSQYCPCGCDHSVKNVSTGDDTKAPSCLNCNNLIVQIKLTVLLRHRKVFTV